MCLAPGAITIQEPTRNNVKEFVECTAECASHLYSIVCAAPDDTTVPTDEPSHYEPIRNIVKDLSESTNG